MDMVQSIFFLFLFFLALHLVMEKKLYRNNWWRTGFIIGIILSIFILLAYIPYCEEPFHLLQLFFLFIPLFLCSTILGLSLLSFSYKKKKGFVLIGILLLLASLFGFFLIYALSQGMGY